MSSLLPPGDSLSQGELWEARAALLTFPFFRAFCQTGELVQVSEKKSPSKMLKIKFKIFKLQSRFCGEARIVITATWTKHNPHV